MPQDRSCGCSNVKGMSFRLNALIHLGCNIQVVNCCGCGVIGRLVEVNKKASPEEKDLLEAALDAGADDVEEGDGGEDDDGEWWYNQSNRDNSIRTSSRWWLLFCCHG